MMIADTVAQMSVHRKPLTRLCVSTTMTDHGVGMRYEGTFKKPTPICQTARKTSAVTVGGSTLPRRALRMRMHRRKQAAQMIAGLDESRRDHAREIARPRQRDAHDLDDTARAFREHDDAIGQERRFRNRVRDED